MLNEDEFYLVAILLENLELCVKLASLLRLAFRTNLGSPQGDGPSELCFIEFLAKSPKRVVIMYKMHKIAYSLHMQRPNKSKYK